MKKSYWLVVFLYTASFVIQAQKPYASAISASHPLATQAGMQMLEQGGNAFDASVAIAAALAVVEPYNSGLGGGGFWLLHDTRKEKQNIVVDARERAPQAATQNMYIKNGQVVESLSKEGALAAAIPGEVAGMVYVSQNFGVLPLHKTLLPAIKLARNGFALDPNFANYLIEHQNLLKQFPTTAAIFYPENKIPKAGDILKQTALADVLENIAKKGLAGFYSQQVGEELLKGVVAAGGIWSKKDLDTYSVKVLQPLVGEYHDMKITTVPLPSAGGLGVLAALNILEEFELKELSDADIKHLVVESLRLVYCDRYRLLGDPEVVKVDVEKLVSKDYAHTLRKQIHMNHAVKSKDLKCGQPGQVGGHTAHFSIIDQQGNIVSATLSLNQRFGSGFVPENTGVLLNNEMDDFSTKVGVPNGDGLVGNSANGIAPGKRPLSSMMPTFFETDQGIGILGSTGGSRIPSMMLLALLKADNDIHPSAWVVEPRYHHQYWPDVIGYEPGAFSAHLQNALKIRGHELSVTDRPYGNMQAIYWDKKHNKIYAASDPRGIGEAIVKIVEPVH